MKVAIVICLKELVIEKFGRRIWDKSLQDVGLSHRILLTPSGDIADSEVVSFIGAVCKNAEITPDQAANAFGNYWVNVYSQRRFKTFYERCGNARDFLLRMDDVHVEMTKNMENARPPRFTYEWKDDNTLIIHYESPRNLIDLLVGLVKGVGTFYRENLQVHKIGPDRIRVVFAN